MSADPRRVLVIQGHPDRSEPHYCHALAQAYAESAGMAGHAVRVLEVAALDLPPLRSKKEWSRDAPTEALLQARENLLWAQHLVIVYPLWLGCMPAQLKAFFEQLARPGFAVPAGPARLDAGLLRGRSARVVVTMGMPGWFYRWYFGAHSLKCLKRNILQFIGIRPVRSSVIGQVEGSAEHRRRGLETMARLGRRAA